MALQFAILTALTDRESSGFELAKRFDRVYGYFWSASHQQIYKELDRLHAAGLVAEVPQPERPGRGQPKHFAITPAGTAALREWIGEIDEPTQPRESLMVKVRASAEVGDIEGLRAVIDHHLTVHASSLGKYADIEKRDFPGADNGADALRHLVLKAGIAMERVWADWCREALDTLDALQARTTADVETHTTPH
ncbi:PadR family transcriptional regulator [Nocardia sp. NPDC059246]|uniref:PadR family transcriptional regulator n=1 Tax=unclassified Nocardia TaxID=2637762 RepID=UPI00367831E4